MAIASDAPATPERKRLAWASDNALVRAVGRIPLPIGGRDYTFTVRLPENPRDVAANRAGVIGTPAPDLSFQVILEDPPGITITHTKPGELAWTRCRD